MKVLAAILILAGASSAAAEGFVEGHAGVMIPLSEDNYTELTDESLKLGVRVGAGTLARAVDLAFDVTPAQTSAPLGEFDATRYRVMVGGRFGAPVAKQVRLVGRVAAGVDIVDATASLGPFEASETDVGVAIELAGGAMLDIGKVSLGVWIGMPIAFHFDDDPDDPDDIELDYTGIDLDITFVAGFRF